VLGSALIGLLLGLGRRILRFGGFDLGRLRCTFSRLGYVLRGSRIGLLACLGLVVCVGHDTSPCEILVKLTHQLNQKTTIPPRDGIAKQMLRPIEVPEL